MLIGEEIEDVIQARGVCLVDFGVLALGARNGGELLVLDIKQLGKCATRCLENICLEFSIVAFGTFPFFMSHNRFLLLLDCIL